MNTLKKLGQLYLKSLLLLIWSTVCVCIGAAWAFIAIITVLKAQGVL